MAAVTLSKKIKSDRDVEERFERCYGNKVSFLVADFAMHRKMRQDRERAVAS